MIAFYREYSDSTVILPQAVAKLPALAKTQARGKASISSLPVTKIPWGHNILLMEKIKDVSVRFWYMQQILEQGWSRDILLHMSRDRVRLSG